MTAEGPDLPDSEVPAERFAAWLAKRYSTDEALRLTLAYYMGRHHDDDAALGAAVREIWAAFTVAVDAALDAAKAARERAAEEQGTD